MKITVGKPLKG